MIIFVQNKYAEALRAILVRAYEVEGADPMELNVIAETIGEIDQEKASAPYQKWLKEQIK